MNAVRQPWQKSYPANVRWSQGLREAQTRRTHADLEALREFLADKLGRHELPAALEIRASLPRTGVGKFLQDRIHRSRAVQTSRLTCAGKIECVKL